MTASNSKILRAKESGNPVIQNNRATFFWEGESAPRLISVCAGDTFTVTVPRLPPSSTKRRPSSGTALTRLRTFVRGRPQQRAPQPDMLRGSPAARILTTLPEGSVPALIIGVALTALAMPITGAPIEHPAALVLAVLLLVCGFGALGTIVGIYAESFDHTSFINNIVILPLTFLGGVFYSVDRLGSPWEQVSHANPLFYVVEAMRYGFLGTSDVSPWIAFAVVTGMCLALLAWSQWLFTSGRKLKP